MKKIYTMQFPKYKLRFTFTNGKYEKAETLDTQELTKEEKKNKTIREWKQVKKDTKQIKKGEKHTAKIHKNLIKAGFSLTEE